jgi:sugar phosphate isomerase/epimerase
VRFRHPDGSTVHLAYCTNVHAAEDFDGVVGQFERFALHVREELGVGRLGLGIWLAAPLAHELASDDALLARLRNELDVRGLEVVTCNGFPYKGFQDEVVKHAVYEPRWDHPERLQYTLDLARVLHRLMPDDAREGSISSLPFGWRDPAPAARAYESLQCLAVELEVMAEHHGRPVRVGLEAEPGCAVETTEQAIEHLAGVAPEWVGVCLDACHMAVQFEDARTSVDALAAAGLPVVKAQLSSALRVVDPKAQAEWLASFVEPRFLHQVRECVDDAVVMGADDLDEALAGALPGDHEWRVHFHVPVHESGESTTQAQLLRVIDALVGDGSPVTRHLEVETYTWSVLPSYRRPVGVAGLVTGIAQELSWARDRLRERGLEDLG